MYVDLKGGEIFSIEDEEELFMKCDNGYVDLENGTFYEDPRSNMDMQVRTAICNLNFEGYEEEE